MASYSRQELVNKYKKRFEDFWKENRSEYCGGIDSTEVQMASVDEMMSAYGYVPRRIQQYPKIRDGRFGYVLAFPVKDSRSKFMTLEAAVSMHNGILHSAYTSTMQRRLSGKICFARKNRVVEKVSLQRNKKSGNRVGLKSQTKFVKFLEEE